MGNHMEFGTFVCAWWLMLKLRRPSICPPHFYPTNGSFYLLAIRQRPHLFIITEQHLYFQQGGARNALRGEPKWLACQNPICLLVPHLMGFLLLSNKRRSDQWIVDKKKGVSCAGLPGKARGCCSCPGAFKGTWKCRTHPFLPPTATIYRV